MPYRSLTDSVTGASGVIVVAVPHGQTGLGVVKVMGQEWSCVTPHPEDLAVGTEVWVIDRQSAILTVIPDAAR